MAVTTASTLKFSDVCLEFYGNSSTVGKSLTGIIALANLNNYWNATYSAGKDSLLDFRGAAAITNTCTVDPTLLTFDGAGISCVTDTITVTSNTSWTVSESDSWITAFPLSGSGNGSISVSVDLQQPGAGARFGDVTVTGSGVTPRVVFIDQGAEGDSCF